MLPTYHITMLALADITELFGTDIAEYIMSDDDTTDIYDYVSELIDDEAIAPPADTAVPPADIPPADVLSADVLAADDIETIDFEHVAGRVVKPRAYRFLAAGEGREPRLTVAAVEQFAAIDPKFIVHNEANRSYLVFDSFAEFGPWFQSTKLRTLHEVVRGGAPQRLKFDIDAAVSVLQPLATDAECSLNECADTVFDEIMAAIDVVFFTRYHIALDRDADFTLSDATDATKFSRHIVIHAFSVANNREAAAFTAAVMDLLPAVIKPMLDGGVNKSTQNFRLPGCHKVGSARIKRCYHGRPEDMIITQTASTHLLPELVAAPVRAAIADADVTTEAVLALAVDAAGDAHEFHRRVGSAFYFTRKHGSHCSICGVEHDKDNTMYVTVSHGNVHLRCRRKQASVVLGQVGDNHRHELVDETIREREGTPLEQKRASRAALIARVEKAPMCDQIPKSFHVERYSEQYLRPFDFGEHDTLLIRSNMGTGKTKKLIELIAKTPDINIIVVSFRCSFTSEITRLLGDGFVDYRDISGKIEERRVVVQFESLHRLILPADRAFMLVIDESESVIGQIENPYMQTRLTNNGEDGRPILHACWERFEWLVKHAAKLIAMDAMAGHRTFDLLAGRKVHMHHNTYSAGGVTDIHYESGYDFLAEVVKYGAATVAPIVDGVRGTPQPMVFVCTSKVKAKYVRDEVAKANPEVRIRLYSGDSTADARRDFTDVNKAWADVDLLIYTSTVTGGCSFELKRFTHMFAYFSDSTVDFKTSIQMLGRVRDIASGERRIFIKRSGVDNLPRTREGVERAIASEHELIHGVRNNPMDAPMMLDARGERRIRHCDLHYKLHVGNLLVRCQSKNSFAYFFRSHRRAAGIKAVERNNPLDAAAVTAEWGRVEKACKKIQIDWAERVADAPTITTEKAWYIERDSNPTDDERASLESYRLAELYGITQEEVTLTVTAYLANPAAKARWECMRHFREGTSARDTIEALRTKAEPEAFTVRSANRKAVDDLFAKPSPDATAEPDPTRLVGRLADHVSSRAVIAMDIHSIVMPEIVSVVGRDDVVTAESPMIIGAAMSRAHLEPRLKKAVEYLQKHSENVAIQFEMRKARVSKTRDTMRAQLDIVNAVLMSAFGMKIEASGQKGERSEFMMISHAWLMWHGGRYVPMAPITPGQGRVVAAVDPLDEADAFIEM